jgi:hypothetical protein
MEAAANDRHDPIDVLAYIETVDANKREKYRKGWVDFRALSNCRVKYQAFQKRGEKHMVPKHLMGTGEIRPRCIIAPAYAWMYAVGGALNQELLEHFKIAAQFNDVTLMLSMNTP